MNETVTTPEAGQLDIYAQIMNAPDWTDANPGMLPDLSAAATSWLLRNDAWIKAWNDRLGREGMPLDKFRRL